MPPDPAAVTLVTVSRVTLKLTPQQLVLCQRRSALHGHQPQGMQADEPQRAEEAVCAAAAGSMMQRTLRWSQT